MPTPASLSPSPRLEGVRLLEKRLVDGRRRAACKPLELCDTSELASWGSLDQNNIGQVTPPLREPSAQASKCCRLAMMRKQQRRRSASWNTDVAVSAVDGREASLAVKRIRLTKARWQQHSRSFRMAEWYQCGSQRRLSSGLQDKQQVEQAGET